MGCNACGTVKHFVTKATNITKAWVNVIVNDPEIEALAEKRMIQCNPCTSKVESLRINGQSVYKCKECSCPIIALVRSNEKCKLNKW